MGKSNSCQKLLLQWCVEQELLKSLKLTREHCIEAALFLLDQGTCVLFNQYGVSQYFDSFRAVSRTPFSFDEYVRLTIGNTQVKWSIKSSSTKSPNRPVDCDLQQLKEASLMFEKLLYVLPPLLSVGCLLSERKIVLANWAFRDYRKEFGPELILHW